MVKVNIYEKRFILSLLAFGFFLGLFLGSASLLSSVDFAEDNLNLLSKDENSEQGECRGACRFNESLHNVDWITQKTEGELYSFNKPNISGMTDRLGLEPFYVDTNLKGLRDEEFQADKPNNLTRVLVLGTSTTFGYGVERNQTFVERAERRLNDKLSRKVQVLNAGSPGYGMEDYYYYLKTRGIEYQPDVVVVASNSIIWRSREDADEVNRLAGQRLQEMNVSNLSEAERRQKFKEFVYKELQDRLDDGIENTGMRFIHDIYEITSKRDMDLVYFSINGLPYSGQKEYIESWANQSEEKVYYAPDDYLYNSERYDNSDLDTHPDEQGHKIISKGFYSALLDELEDQ